MKPFQKNIVFYGSFLIIAIIGIYYGNAIQSNYSFLRIWEFQNIVILGLGIPFLFLQSKASLPNFFENNISNKERFIRPLLIGIVFGLLDVLVIKVIQHPEPYTELPPFLQPFPYSIFLYFSGALEIEVFYRLIPITSILLLGKWVADRKYFTYFLWTAVIATSLREPLEQLPNGSDWFIAYSLLTGFLMTVLRHFILSMRDF